MDIVDPKPSLPPSLTTKEDWLSSIAANIPGVVYQFYARGEQWGMHLVSDKALEIFGLAPEPSTFVDRFIECLSEADRAPFIEGIREAVNTEQPWFYEGSFLRPDGREIRFRGHSTPKRTESELIFDGILVDVTEQRRAEEEALHAQRMDSIGQLAGGIAHDFNNMLSGIMGAAELLVERLADRPQLQELARMIMDTSTRAGELTWQLLAFSRKGVHSKGIHSLHEILEQTLKLLEHSIDRRIVLQGNYDAVEDCIVGDAAQLQAAFLNLGVNARDAMPQGGRLSFSTSIKEMGADSRLADTAHFLAPGKYIQVRVEDTGAGIADSVAERIWEPFFTTKPRGKGTGLGLAAAHGTFEEHQGRIRLDKTSSAGTCFVILLPLSDAAPATTQPPSSRTKSLSCRVLLIDDERVVRTTARRMMESMGYEVSEASDGLEGLRLLQKYPGRYDIVVLDMMMPEMSGQETFSKLRKMVPDLPIVLCTGLSLDESVMELKRLKHTGHLSKPFRRKDLLEALSEAINR